MRAGDRRHNHPGRRGVRGRNGGLRGTWPVRPVRLFFITTSRTTIVNNEDGTVSTTKSEHTAEIVSDVSSHEANKKTQAEEDPEAGAAVIHRPESEGGSAAVRRFVDLATFANTHTRPRDGDDVCDCFRCAQLWRP